MPSLAPGSLGQNVRELGLISDQGKGKVLWRRQLNRAHTMRKPTCRVESGSRQLSVTMSCHMSMHSK